MTGYGEDSSSNSTNKANNSDEKEQKRLEAILKNAEQTWKRGLGQLNEDESLLVGGNKRKRDTQNNPSEEASNEEEGMLSLLSPELREQFAGMEGLAILPSGGSKKKKAKKKELPPLTPAEIKAAKALYKNTQRKLAQLEQRRKQKELRSGLYKELEDNALLAPVAAKDVNDDGNPSASNNATANQITPQEAQSLLLKSSELGKKLSKKQKLKQIRQKEALGLKLTQEEMDLLYVKYDAPEEESFPVDAVKVEADAKETEGTSVSKKKKSKKKKRRKSDAAFEDGDNIDDGDAHKSQEPTAISLKKAKHNTDSKPDNAADTNVDKVSNPAKDGTNTISTITKEATDTKNSSELKPPSTSYAQMMLAGLSSLKTKTDSQNIELANDKVRKQQEAEEEAMRLEEEERKHRKVYVPSETIKVSTLHRLDAPVDTGTVGNKKHAVQTIKRPADVEESRYDLPVSAMEFEIIDAVRSNDCTILCGETGSGKSTQVPQFLYEAGFSIQKNDATNNPESDQQLLIGITQPRRVAAVSTAKRVCYEMGHGDGQSISRGRSGGAGNLVAYQTRYETAGLGSSTHIKFMTDGILLQEIQSDLLLRKYGAIVIDEAHERNLNTDVLLGLLSVALPLRRKAASEGSLPPLKLVIMSATLRVEDFTENPRLFPKGDDGVVRQPALVKVPGRTFPVSIHHSKVTELDKYGVFGIVVEYLFYAAVSHNLVSLLNSSFIEKVALDKTCKIHRKLPPGGILVFLTGKQEVVRMVNRLRQKLEPRAEKKKPSNIRQTDQATFTECTPTNEALDGFRDMDDEEVDGDLFQGEDVGVDDFDEAEQDDNVVADPLQEDDNDKRPRKVRVLPLYSMLSVDEQAKVFAPVPEDTRLIVIATNIAESESFV